VWCWAVGLPGGGPERALRHSPVRTTGGGPEKASGQAPKVRREAAPKEHRDAAARLRIFSVFKVPRTSGKDPLRSTFADGDYKTNVLIVQ
jgi:hypothetical protein